MKKSYSKAEAFRVAFNASEQVAAACDYTEADYSSKYPVDNGETVYSYCTEDNNLYSDGSIGMCVIYSDGTTYMGDSWDYNTMVQYLD